MADQTTAFLDLEASGLGADSWPIEVGWAIGETPPVAMLIKPDTNWSQAAWDPAAAALHGVRLSDLQARGHAIREVCETMNAALKGMVVYSDAPDWDGFWLYRLFQACGLRQAFRLGDFTSFFDGIASEVMQTMVDEATRSAPHIHRAGPDVAHMQALHAIFQKMSKDSQ